LISKARFPHPEAICVAVLGVATLSAPAAAQTAAPPVSQEASGSPSDLGAFPDAENGTSVGPDIVVTGIRSSLERAAEVKRGAIQVVDSIVAQDIGKLPDPTTAAALQRVPGVQVEVNRDNELSGVRIRGLTDVLSTVDGREIFSTTSRSFELTSLPAEALARVDVYKSQTANLIEGAVAGTIDLKLNKPFSFKKPTLVVTARENYGSRLGKGGGQFGILAADRAETGIGEIGALLNLTYSHTPNERSQSNMTDRRSSASGNLSSPGFLIPQVIQNMPFVGAVTRKQANAALQWQVTPSVQAYVDGLYTYFRTTNGFTGFNPQPFTAGTSIASVTPSSDCFQTRVNAGGTNPTITTNANGTTTLQPYTVQTLCDVKSVTFNNITVNQNSSSLRQTERNKLIAGGLRFDRDATKVVLDAGYQTSTSYVENVNLEGGQKIPTLTIDTDVDGGEETILAEQYPLSSALYLRNGFNQNFTFSKGSLFQAKVDGTQDFGGILQNLQVGLRFASRQADFNDIQQNNNVSTVLGIGDVGTPTARLITSLGLSPDVTGIIGYAPRLNGGSYFAGISPDYLRSESGRNELRRLFRLPLGAPAFDRTRSFSAEEKTYSTYLQGNYKIPLGGDLAIDGVVGLRAVKTDRTISGFRNVPGQGIVPVAEQRSDTDLLPAATARLVIPGGLQFRLNYSRTIRRPDFATLNPTQSLTFVSNPLLINSGSAGNPDLRAQKSDSFDATAELYFKSGFVAVTGYYRTIKDRVVTSSAQETIDGANFLISRPRNVGDAKLKGVEASTQYFFDFLPGALSGFGAIGAFTFADSEIGGTDQLAGNPLQGVSKYNYTAGAVYDKYGLSARLVYTFRSKYFTEDNSGAVALRPIDPDRVADVFVPTLLTYVRPAGRLDFSVGYDVTDALRIDVGGTNVLRNQTKTYRGPTFINTYVFGDETVYTIGARARF
jgi:TonB-dependent receptor